VGGERIFFTADDGSILSDLDALVAVARLLFTVYPGVTIGVPVTAPHLLEQIAAEHGGSVRRLKLGQTAHMKEAVSGNYAMIADGRGSFIFPAFSPFHDGMFAIAKIMELTTQVGQTLSDVWRHRATYHLARASIPCPLEEKGRVIRRLREQFRDESTDSAEGILIERNEEWILILPDPDAPCFWVHAEGRDDARAHELVDEYNALVNVTLHEPSEPVGAMVRCLATLNAQTCSARNPPTDGSTD
jgi:mannose-1-phosphate guanylyltransferase/phosphomannomutase